MCLSTRLKKPLVAKKDIVCYKYLDKCLDGYKTPYRDTKVQIGAVFKADRQDKKYEGDYPYGYKHQIEGGFIHAVLGRNGGEREWGDVIVKGIIHKGMEFYIGDSLYDICAREIELTDEIINEKDMPTVNEAIRDLFDDYFADLFEPEVEVGVGFYRLADGSYLNPVNFTKELELEIDGVVSDIRDGKVYVVSLDETCLPWTNIDWGDRKFIGADFKGEPENDLDGEGHTKKILSHNTYTEQNYPAVAWCAAHETKGVKKGEWHFGAIGEVIPVGRTNMLTINVALALLENSDLISMTWLWSSSEFNSYTAWILGPSNGNVTGYHKYDSYRVRAFAVFAVAKD